MMNHLPKIGFSYDSPPFCAFIPVFPSLPLVPLFVLYLIIFSIASIGTAERPHDSPAINRRNL